MISHMLVKGNQSREVPAYTVIIAVSLQYRNNLHHGFRDGIVHPFSHLCLRRLFLRLQFLITGAQYTCFRKNAYGCCADLI